MNLLLLPCLFLFFPACIGWDNGNSLEVNRKWEKPDPWSRSIRGVWELHIPIPMEEKLHQVSQETIRSCEYILLKFLHRTRAMPYISNDVVCRVIHQ